MGDLTDDLKVVGAKIVALANAMPPAAYDWRPGSSVRSTAEVLIHMAGDN
jgi:DinB family protein